MKVLAKCCLLANAALVCLHARASMSCSFTLIQHQHISSTLHPTTTESPHTTYTPAEMSYITEPPSDLVNESFTKAFNKAQTLYDENKLDDCLKEVRALLDESAMPKYHRMRTLLLLTSIATDWKEAEEARVAAEALWRLVRKWHTEDSNLYIEQALVELRAMLDEAKDNLAQERLERGDVATDKTYDPEAAVQQLLDQHEKNVAVELAQLDDEDLLEEIDLKILNISKEESYKKLAEKKAKVTQ